VMGLPMVDEIEVGQVKIGSERTDHASKQDGQCGHRAPAHALEKRDRHDVARRKVCDEHACVEESALLPPVSDSATHQPVYACGH
jgi:hypothetical protein